MFDGMIILGNIELFNDRTCEYGWLTMHVGNTLVSGFSMFFSAGAPYAVAELEGCLGWIGFWIIALNMRTGCLGGSSPG